MELKPSSSLIDTIYGSPPPPDMPRRNWFAAIPLLLFAGWFAILILGVVLDSKTLRHYRYQSSAWFAYEIMALWAMTFLMFFHEIIVRGQKAIIPFAILMTLSFIQQTPLRGFGYFLLILIPKAGVIFGGKGNLRVGAELINELFLHSLAGMLTLFSTGIIMISIIWVEVEMWRAILPCVGGLVYYGCLGLIEMNRGWVLETRARMYNHSQESARKQKEKMLAMHNRSFQSPSADENETP